MPSHNRALQPDPAQDQGPCVFISHRSADKPAARLLADLMRSISVDYWLDEEDLDLQAAQTSGDAASVVLRIEQAITRSNHPISVISPRTRGSWWVPFEVGAARRAWGAADPSRLVTLVLPGVDDLPEYFRLTRNLTSTAECHQWVARLPALSFLVRTAVALDSALDQLLPHEPRNLRYTPA